MSTRSNIAIERENGEIEVIYVHFDGYLRGGVGEMLLKHHNSFDAASELIALGDLSSLGALRNPPPNVRHTYEKPVKGVTVAYGRDRGETDTKALRYLNAKTWSNNWEEHNYLWSGGETGAWWYIPKGTAKRMQLKLALGAEVADFEQAQRAAEHRVATQKQDDADELEG